MVAALSLAYRRTNRGTQPPDAGAWKPAQGLPPDPVNLMARLDAEMGLTVQRIWSYLNKSGLETE
jgi:hypothetical protein